MNFGLLLEVTEDSLSIKNFFLVKNQIWNGKMAHLEGEEKDGELTLTAASEPPSLKSSYFITSAIMNPFSKSVWIFPAAWGAFVPFCQRKDQKKINCI